MNEEKVLKLSPTSGSTDTSQTSLQPKVFDIVTVLAINNNQYFGHVLEIHDPTFQLQWLVPTCTFPKVLSDFRQDTTPYTTTESLSCITSILSTTSLSPPSHASTASTKLPYPINQFKELQELESRSNLHDFMKIICACLTSHVKLTWSLFGTAFIDWIKWMQLSDNTRFITHIESLLNADTKPSKRFSAQFIHHTLKTYFLNQPRIYTRIATFFQSVIEFMDDAIESNKFGFCPLSFCDGNQDKYTFSLTKVVQMCWKVSDGSRFGIVKNLSAVYEFGFDLFLQEQGKEMGMIVETAIGRLSYLLLQEYVWGILEGVVDDRHDVANLKKHVVDFFGCQVDELVRRRTEE